MANCAQKIGDLIHVYMVNMNNKNHVHIHGAMIGSCGVYYYEVAIEKSAAVQYKNNSNQTTKSIC